MEAKRQRLLQATQNSDTSPSCPENQPLILQALIEAMKQEDPENAKELERISDIYQKSVLQLQESTQENQMLLEATNRSIQKILGEEKATYSPSADSHSFEGSSPKKLESPGILFNTKV